VAAVPLQQSPVEDTHTSDQRGKGTAAPFAAVAASASVSAASSAAAAAAVVASTSLLMVVAVLMLLTPIADRHNLLSAPLSSSIFLQHNLRQTPLKVKPPSTLPVSVPVWTASSVHKIPKNTFEHRR
jgi:hypothetical protein